MGETVGLYVKLKEDPNFITPETFYSFIIQIIFKKQLILVNISRDNLTDLDINNKRKLINIFIQQHILEFKSTDAVIDPYPSYG